MCNQAAGLIWCLTKVQDFMVTQLKILHNDKGKGESSSNTQEDFDELDYLVTFNRCIAWAMTRTMQVLCEGIFINMINLTLTHRDTYLDY